VSFFTPWFLKACYRVLYVTTFTNNDPHWLNWLFRGQFERSLASGRNWIRSNGMERFDWSFTRPIAPVVTTTFIILAARKSRTVTFRYRLTRVVLENGRWTSVVVVVVVVVIVVILNTVSCCLQNRRWVRVAWKWRRSRRRRPSSAGCPLAATSNTPSPLTAIPRPSSAERASSVISQVWPLNGFFLAWPFSVFTQKHVFFVLVLPNLNRSG